MYMCTRLGTDSEQGSNEHSVCVYTPHNVVTGPSSATEHAAMARLLLAALSSSCGLWSVQVNTLESVFRTRHHVMHVNLYTVEVHYVYV